MEVPSRPRRRTGVMLVRIGSDGLLYDSASVRVHRLNPTALLVWECCDGTASLDEIIGEIAEQFGETTESIGSAVLALVEDLAGNGLLAVTSDVETPRTATVTAASPHHSPGPLGQPLRRLGPYAALDLRFTIECHDSKAIAAEIERALDSMAVPPPGAGPTDDATMIVWSDGVGGWNLDDETGRLNASDQSVITDFLLWQVTRLAVERSSRYLIVHASAVARDGIAVAFPAQANSGKSTLATILVEAGYDYLTDEATAIDLDTGELVAYPKPITLDPGSQRLLAHLDPDGLAGESSKWRIAPTDVRPGSVVERAVLTHLVVPTFEPGADNALVPIATIDAVIALLGGAFNLAEHGDRLDDIVALVEGCTTYSLRHDGIAGPVAAIASLF